MIVTLIIYLALAFSWAAFLEDFTTTQLEGEFGRPWTWLERGFHIILFPISFLIFAYHFIKGYLEETNNEE